MAHDLVQLVAVQRVVPVVVHGAVLALQNVVLGVGQVQLAPGTMTGDEAPRAAQKAPCESRTH